VVSPEVALVMSLERSLLRAAERRSPQVLDALIAPDFREVGASGRRWTRAEIVAAMLAEDGPLGPDVADHDMVGTELADGLVLLEFVTDAQGRWARRTSLWRRVAPGAWQTFLHQGTLAPDLGP